MLRRVSLSLAAAIVSAGALALEEPALTGNPWHWVGTQTPVDWLVVDDPAKYTVQFNADSSLACAPTAIAGAARTRRPPSARSPSGRRRSRA